MKKLVCLVALAGFCEKPSYGMEKAAGQKQENECKDCIKVGPCKWGLLAVQLGGLHAGNPLQQVSIPVQKGEKGSDIKSPASTVTHCSGRTEADVSSENGSDDSWENESWSDMGDWDDLGDKQKQE